MEPIFILLASTWLPPAAMPIPPLEDPGAAVASAPVCATMESGAFLLVWEEKRGAERRVIVRRREPGPEGEWGIPSRVDTGTAAQAIEPRIAVAGSHVFLVWQELEPGLAGEAYFRRSTDEGRTWSTDPMRLPAEGEGVAVASMISIAANPTGVVLAAWEDQRSGVRDIVARRSVDFGASWEPFETRLDADGPRGPAASYHPQIVLQESATVVWWDEGAGLSDVQARTSRDQGTTWNEIIRLDSGRAGEAASRDAAVASSQGILAIAWEDEAGGLEREILARLSSDSGETWSAESRMGRPRWAGAIEDPRVAIDGEGRAHIIWIAIPGEEKPRQGERASISIKSKNRPESAAALFHAAVDFKGRVLDPIAVPAAVPKSGLAWIGGRNSVLWMAWVGTRIDGGSIEAAFSTDCGRTWRASGLPRAQNPEAVFVPVPSLAGSVDANGSLHLVWVEGRAERERLRFVRLETAVGAGE